MKRNIAKFFLVIILFLSIVVFNACESFYAIGLYTRSLFSSVQVLTLDKSNQILADQGDTIDWQASITAPIFSGYTSVSIVEGELPRGLKILSEQSESDYLLILQGVPEEVGNFRVKIKLSCCGTMSGPTTQAVTDLNIQIN